MSAFAPAAGPESRAKVSDLPQSRLAAAAVCCLAGLWALAWHIPAHGLQEPDDGFFMAVAHLWISGAPPYLNAFDVKPPGFFALLALAQSLFGASEATLNGLTAVSDAIAAIALWRIGRRLGGPSVGAFAAFAYPALSQMLAANPVYPPLAAATTTAFALALSPFALTARAALAGLAIGFAITIKQTAFLEALALLWIILRDREAEGRRLRVALAFTAGAATAPLAFALIFAADGAFAPLVADVFEAAMQRPKMGGEPLTQNVARFISVQSKIWPVATLAAIAATQWRSLFPGAPAGRAEGIALWFAASWLELTLQHSRWLYYLGPTFAPALLLSGGVIAAMLQTSNSSAPHSPSSSPSPLSSPIPFVSGRSLTRMMRPRSPSPRTLSPSDTRRRRTGCSPSTRERASTSQPDSRRRRPISTSCICSVIFLAPGPSDCAKRSPLSPVSSCWRATLLARLASLQPRARASPKR